MSSPSSLFDPKGGRVSRAKRAVTMAAAPYSRARHLARIIERRSVQPAYQPIVRLDDRSTVAFESLARGPQGTPMERPDLLFGTAREIGMVRELDWICRAKAMEDAMSAGFNSSLSLFINVEPDVAATRAPDDLFFVLRKAQRDLRVILEVTERAVLQRPAELLHWLNHARDRWWGVALDDVGATSESLALLPFVRPDVVKLNHHFVREEHTREDLRVLEAVHNYSDRTGASIVAEGIETRQNLERAQEELRADLGQGWFFGRPTSLPSNLPRPRRVVPLLNAPEVIEEESPWNVVRRVAEVESLPEAAVRRRFAAVEQSSMLSREAPVVLASFPPGPGPWGAPVERLARLRDRACYCGSLGLGFPMASEAGWHTAPLKYGEEMANEWVLLSIAPHQADVVVAFDAHETDGEGHRLLDVCASSDRGTVALIAEMLMRKLAGPTVGIDGQVKQ